MFGHHSDSRRQKCAIWASSLDPSVILLNRSTFVAPWRRSESSRSSSVSERGTPRMSPFFLLGDFGRLVLRDLLAALVIFRKASCCEWSIGKIDRSPP